MSHVYVLTNQRKQFLSKGNEWLDGREAGKLFRSPHKDVAINQMFEANARDVNLRIELLQCELSAKGQPQVPWEVLGDPQPIPQEVPVENPAEVPPEQAPEVEPQPAPEAEPQEPPEVAPEEAPEIQPQQPDEVQGDEGEAKATTPQDG